MININNFILVFESTPYAVLMSQLADACDDYE